MRRYTIAVLGAAGPVGREVIRALWEREFPVREVRAMDDARHAGEILPFGGAPLEVRECASEALLGVDIAFGAAGGDESRCLAHRVRNAGAVWIDCSDAFRSDVSVPLVIPELNPEDAMAHRGILSNPSAATVIALMAVGALHRESPIRSMVVTVCQPASEEECGATAGQAREIAPCAVPMIGSLCPNGYTDEEMKLQEESRRILHAPDLRVSCTSALVPMARGCAVAIRLVSKRPIAPSRARALIADAAGCALWDEPEAHVRPAPSRIREPDGVMVGRIRRDLTDGRGLCLWCCGDGLRRGLALNAVQIAELLI